MKPPFFITGLPRSRTSWLANLFTTGAQFCHHDLLGRVESLTDFAHCLNDGQGDSDSGLIFLWQELTRLTPASRWLLVLRDPVESVEALLRAAHGTDWEAVSKVFADTMGQWRPAYERNVALMCRDERVEVIRFEDLDCFEKVTAAVDFVCPGMELKRERFELLNGLRIEPIPAKCPLTLQPEFLKNLRELWPSLQQ